MENKARKRKISFFNYFLSPNSKFCKHIGLPAALSTKSFTQLAIIHLTSWSFFSSHFLFFFLLYHYKTTFTESFFCLSLTWRKEGNKWKQSLRSSTFNYFHSFICKCFFSSIASTGTLFQFLTTPGARQLSH